MFFDFRLDFVPENWAGIAGNGLKDEMGLADVSFELFGGTSEFGFFDIAESVGEFDEVTGGCHLPDFFNEVLSPDLPDFFFTKIFGFLFGRFIARDLGDDGCYVFPKFLSNIV